MRGYRYFVHNLRLAKVAKTSSPRSSFAEDNDKHVREPRILAIAKILAFR
jgi:hypothetical protein